MKRILCFAGLLMALSYFASGQTRYELPCNSADDAWTTRICAGEESKKALHELDSLFQKLLTKMRACKASIDGKDSIGIQDRQHEEDAEKLVITSQQKWLEYYRSALDIRENLWEGGSGISEAVSTEATQITRERILEIDDLLSYYKNW
jgi:uncharacterized protein YecT (DUF1311 family)